MRGRHEHGARPVGRGVLTAALCASLALALGARAEEGGTPSPPSSPRASFEQLYARLTATADGAGPPAGVVAAAEEIRFGLETDLIRADADVEVAKLAAMRYSGERQRQALEALAAAAAARERRLWIALRRLERLAGEAAPPVAQPATAAQEEAATESDASKNRAFEISFEPADVAEDPDP